MSKRTKYFVEFHGTIEQVEHMIRTMDILFRKYYNVYGGCRETSRRGEQKNEYVVVMSYDAYWSTYSPSFHALIRGMDRIESRCRMDWSYELDDGTFSAGAWYEICGMEQYNELEDGTLNKVMWRA